jgi:hypothetical protein
MEIINAVSGPNIKPPIAITISFASYLRNKTTGIRIATTKANANAHSIPVSATFFALLFIIRTSFFHPDYTVGFGITPNHAYFTLADFTADRESHPALKAINIQLTTLLYNYDKVSQVILMYNIKHNVKICIKLSI